MRQNTLRLSGALFVPASAAWRLAAALSHPAAFVGVGIAFLAIGVVFIAKR